MNYKARRAIYRRIERDRGTKVITYVASDRAGMETIIAPDCIDLGLWRPNAEEPDHRHRRLLRTRREWPRSRSATDKRG